MKCRQIVSVLVLPLIKPHARIVQRRGGYLFAKDIDPKISLTDIGLKVIGTF